MEEIAHDPVAHRPVVPVAGDMVGAHVFGAGRRVSALDADAHGRPPPQTSFCSIASPPPIARPAVDVQTSRCGRRLLCGAVSAPLLRYALGVIPVTRRNVVVK